MPNYYRWIVAHFEAHLGNHVVEFGAGRGAISKLLLSHAERLDLVEPSTNLVETLNKRFAGSDGVTVRMSTIEKYLDGETETRPDSAVLVNVLEHIEDDLAALKGLRGRLKKGGKLLLFVPATPFLFSKLDEEFGHYRRYTLSSLKGCVESAGYAVLTARYMDFLGMVPWWLVNTVGGRTDFDPRMVRLYDTIGMPVTRLIEGFVRIPIGKNLLLIAENSG